MAASVSGTLRSAQRTDYKAFKTYRNVLEEKENCGEIKEITDPFGEDAIDRYEQKVLAFVTVCRRGF